MYDFPADLRFPYNSYLLNRGILIIASGESSPLLRSLRCEFRTKPVSIENKPALHRPILSRRSFLLRCSLVCLAVQPMGTDCNLILVGLIRAACTLILVKPVRADCNLALIRPLCAAPCLILIRFAPTVLILTLTCFCTIRLTGFCFL